MLHQISVNNRNNYDGFLKFVEWILLVTHIEFMVLIIY